MNDVLVVADGIAFSLNVFGGPSAMADLQTRLANPDPDPQPLLHFKFARRIMSLCVVDEIPS
ncbi:hypothetical protein QTP88_023490 [Uroleucon formosanum]